MPEIIAPLVFSTFFRHISEVMQSSSLTTSVLIATWKRPDLLERAVRSLWRQTTPPTEIIVCWQADDLATRDRLQSLQLEHSACPLVAVHLPQNGIVPAENAALNASRGDLILLLDDDAIAPPNWVARIVAFFENNPKCGAFGGPADCWTAEGHRLPVNPRTPPAGLSWLGRLTTNLHDQPPEWRTNPPERVDHLVGYNMALRRAGFSQFEEALRSYWQLFELEACLQISSKGLEIWFDPGLVVEHRVGYTTGAYAPGREGDWAIRFQNSSYNMAYVLSKHTTEPIHRLCRLLFLIAVGSTSLPGPLLLPITITRHGHPLREMRLAATCVRWKIKGWFSATKRAFATPCDTINQK